MPNFRLIHTGKSKINIIKLIKEYTGLSLKETKELVDRAPSEFMIHDELIDVQQVLNSFNLLGATIELLNGPPDMGNGYPKTRKMGLKLINSGPNKIEVIKIIRTYTDLGLKDSKNLVEQVPSIFEIKKAGVTLAECIQNFEKAGAIVEKVIEDVQNNSMVANDEIPPSSDGQTGIGSTQNTIYAEQGLISNRVYKNPENKFQSYSTNIDSLMPDGNTGNQQLPVLKNALIFVNVAAVLFSMLGAIAHFGHFLFIYFLAFITAYLLRMKNQASIKLGFYALLLILDFTVLRSIVSIIIWPFINDYPFGLGIANSFRIILYSINIHVIVAAGVAFFFSSNQGMFKNLNGSKNIDQNGKNQQVFENKEIIEHKKKVKF